MRTTTATGSTSGATLLLVAFIVLKLTGVITWSWVWVLAPLWVPLAIGLLLLAVAAVLYAVDDRRQR